jgi:hypothetical protein
MSSNTGQPWSAVRWLHIYHQHYKTMKEGPNKASVWKWRKQCLLGDLNEELQYTEHELKLRKSTEGYNKLAAQLRFVRCCIMGFKMELLAPAEREYRKLFYAKKKDKNDWQAPEKIGTYGAFFDVQLDLAGLRDQVHTIVESSLQRSDAELQYWYARSIPSQFVDGKIHEECGVAIPDGDEGLLTQYLNWVILLLPDALLPQSLRNKKVHAFDAIFHTQKKAANDVLSNAGSPSNAMVSLDTDVDKHVRGQKPSKDLKKRFFVPVQARAQYFTNQEIFLVARKGTEVPLVHELTHADACCGYCTYCKGLFPKTVSGSNTQLIQHLNACKLQYLNGKENKRKRSNERKNKDDSKKRQQITNSDDHLIIPDCTSDETFVADAATGEEESITNEHLMWLLSSPDALSSFVKDPSKSAPAALSSNPVDEVFKLFKKAATEAEKNVKQLIKASGGGHSIQIVSIGPYICVDVTFLTDTFEKISCRIDVIDQRKTMDIRTAIDTCINKYDIKEVVWTTIGQLETLSRERFNTTSCQDFSLPAKLMNNCSCVVASYTSILLLSLESFWKVFPNIRLKVFSHSKEMDSVVSNYKAMQRFIDKAEPFAESRIVVEAIADLIRPIYKAVDALQQNILPNAGVAIKNIRLTKTLMRERNVDTERVMSLLTELNTIIRRVKACEQKRAMAASFVPIKREIECLRFDGTVESKAKYERIKTGLDCIIETIKKHMGGEDTKLMSSFTTLHLKALQENWDNQAKTRAAECASVARRKVAILLTKAEILKGMDDTFGALALNPNPPLGFAGYLDP